MKISFLIGALVIMITTSSNAAEQPKTTYIDAPKFEKVIYLSDTPDQKKIAEVMLGYYQALASRRFICLFIFCFLGKLLPVNKQRSQGEV